MSDNKPLTCTNVTATRDGRRAGRQEIGEPGAFVTGGGAEDAGIAVGGATLSTRPLMAVMAAMT
ncbi:hypothetical protein C3488_16865 [Streptomyces sp. Ru72]|nr:hypothetical protein C3488_16865 [Streptomyces sp. Ru72]